MSVNGSPALPITEVVIRILIILNWLMFAATLFLLLAPITRDWIMSEFALTPSPAADRVVGGLRLVALVGLVTLPLYYLILTRLLAMVRSARAGEAFDMANAERLRAIGWFLVGLQVCGLVIAIIVDAISTKARPIDIDAGPSVAGWLGVLLCFVLAQVFADGARMRDDLEGTV